MALDNKLIDEGIHSIIGGLKSCKYVYADVILDALETSDKNAIEDAFIQILETLDEVLHADGSDLFESVDVLDASIDSAIVVIVDYLIVEIIRDPLIYTSDVDEERGVAAAAKFSRIMNNGRGRGRQGLRSRQSSGRQGGRNSRASGSMRPTSRGQEPARNSRRRSPNSSGVRSAGGRFREQESNVQDEPRSTRTRGMNSARTRSGRLVDETESVTATPDVATLSDEFVNVVYDSETHGVYKDKNGLGVIVTHEEGIEMETYEAHELRTSKKSRKSTGRIVRIADMRDIEDPKVDSKLPEDTPIVVRPNILTMEAADLHIPTMAYNKLVEGMKTYQVSIIKVVSEFTITKSVIDALNEAEAMDIMLDTFEDLNEWLNRAILIVRDSDEATDTDTSVLMAIDKRLTEVFNDMLIHLGTPARIASFADDFQDAFDWLNKDDNVDIYLAYNEMQNDLIKNMIKIEATPVLEANDEDTSTTTPLSITSTVYHVKVKGDMSNLLSHANATATFDTVPGRIDYSITPQFHTACMGLITHRNKKYCMAPVLLLDDTDTEYKLYATNVDVPVLKVLKY